MMKCYSKVITIFLSFTVLCAISRGDPSEENAETKAATENKDFGEEDADMLMEPNDFMPINLLRSQERSQHEGPSPTSIMRTTRQLRQTLNPRMIPATRGGDFVQRRSSTIDSHTQAAQNYYPPFFRESPPLGHSRPYFPQTDGGGSSLLNKFNEARSISNLVPQQRSLNYDQSILGSGDFGIIRGGTFYPDEELPYHTEDSLDFVQKYTYPEEQFAQFRDFADINTPVDGAFSQYVVIYENQGPKNTNNTKNSNSRKSSRAHPNNIFEQLQLLDRENEEQDEENGMDGTEEGKKVNGLSKTKAKLAKTRLQLKKYNTKKPATGDLEAGMKRAPNKNDLDTEMEPLLALS